jgi:CRP-like cAMP-binding protein
MQEKSEEDVRKLTEILRRHFIFYTLDDFQLKKVIDEMIYCFSPKEVHIIPQGSMASFFFVLDDGEVSILINGEHKRTLVAGQFFGDLALLYNSRRSATVKAVTDCKMWGITRDAFRNLIKKIKTEQYKENRDMLNKVTLFGI